MSNNDPLIVKLNNVRLSFPSLHEKRQFKDGKPAYQASFLLDPKKNADDIKRLQAAIAQLVKDEFGGKALSPDRVCLQDNKVAGKEYDGYDDMFFIKSSNSKTKPGLVDNEFNEVSSGDAADPYPGCYVNARVRLWAQNGKTVKMDATFGKRINAQLKNVQVLLRGGKPYGEAFGEEREEAAAGFEKVEESLDEAGV